MVRPFHHPATAQITLDGVLHALSDPVRRQIVAKLLASADAMCCSDTCTGLSPSTTSFHHRVLREAGLIRSRKSGVHVVNTVRVADLSARFPGLLEAILQHDGTAE